jgi:hypothetical protein
MRRIVLSAVVSTLLVVSHGLQLAAPPPEVGPTLLFGPDKSTIVWEAVPGAERYNVYRGEMADGSDLSCLFFRTADTQGSDLDLPVTLFTYVVSAWNTDGEGSLGHSTGQQERIPVVRCADDDGDQVRDDWDNCPGLHNPDQYDQDQDGQGDPCDPATYTFEDDTIGQRPAGVTQDGGEEPSFVVRDHAGDRGVSYDGGAQGVHDRFDRVPAWRPQQDIDVYIDRQDLAGETGTLEIWSEGTWIENAGGGLQFRVEADGRVAARVRRGQEMTALGDAAIASTDRLRLRLRKGPGSESILHVDRWTGASWEQDAARFTASDDHRLLGTGLALANHEGGRSPVLRITSNALAPGDPFGLNLSFDGLDHWKLLQRGPDGDAPLPLPYAYRASDPVRLEARVVESSNGLPLPGHDFADHSWDLPAAPEGRSDQVVLASVPEGGNYDVEARLVDPDSGGILGEDAALQVAVGDVFLAVGQSNMAGYSGNMNDPESPVDSVHLFGNDYRWKRAQEPMDAAADQVDRVSEENPLHSLMLRFAKEVSSATGLPVAIVPAPLGGTNLHTQWQRDSNDPANRGTLYGSSVYRVMAQGYAHPIRGAIWYQGESDVGRGTAAYLADLQQLVADYRSDLGSPLLFFGNCQLATYQWSNLWDWLAIQEAQRLQAVADPLSAAVALVDQPRSDTIHLNVPGYKEAGRRLAQAVLAGSYGETVPLGPQLVEVRFEAGRRNRIEVVYDKEVTGGLPGLYQATDQDGPVTVSSVSSAGSIVTVRLQNPAKGETLLTYGFSKDPAASWVVAADGAGAALAFLEIVVTP